MSRINTNVSSLIAQNTLGRNNADLNLALQRLSTGLRINSGKDDPAGLIASESLRADITSVNKAITNTSRASQLIATADAALGQVSGLLNDIRGLVVEAANSGALSDEQVAANQLQIDSSLEAIDRIAQTTTFQGKTLLDGSLDFITTAGAGFSTVSDLTVDQANLGSTGAISVAVDISTAATQAQVTTTPTIASTVTIDGNTFTLNEAAGQSVDGTTVSLVSDTAEASGSFTVGSQTFGVRGAEGLATDNIDVNLVSDSLEATGNLTVGSQTFALSLANGQTADNVQVDVDYGLVEATGDVVEDGITFSLQADSGQTVDDVDVTFTTADLLGAGASASFSGNTLTVTLDTNGGQTTDTAANIASAIANDTNFTVSNSPAGTLTYANLSGSTHTDAVIQQGAKASYSTGTLTLTISDQDNAVSAATITAAVDALTEFAGTAATGSGSIDGTAGTDATGAATLTQSAVSATYNSGGPTLNVTFNSLQNAITATQVQNAIDAITEFSGTQASGSGTIDGNTVSGGVATTLTIKEVDAYYDSNNKNLTLTIDKNDSSISTAAVIAAIDGLTEFDGTTVAAAGAIDGTAVESNANVATISRVRDLIVRISGSEGSEVFNFEAGTSLSQIVDAVNLVSDATGVVAAVNDTTSELSFDSVTYGSNAIVDIEVISEGAGGTFESGLSASRANGTDVQARINGVKANGSGNKLSINTATLDISLTVENGSSTDVNFAINGGGAVFQLGPDVVSNQQARIGIKNLNTATLGGSAGRLYELRSGNARALDTDATGAAKIVDQTIEKVVGLRGRLGAFQRTTLETNIASLNDYLANLTESESSIRDADFAKESAALTRAQVLVQSGTSVLSIANSQPQNVLALLR